MTEASPPDFRLRLKRDTAGIQQFLREAWGHWWGKAIAICAGLFVAVMFLGWLLFARDLPSVDALRLYEPPLPTNVRDIDGTPVHSYARERRIELSYDEYPPLLIRAFLAAEDKSFFEHHGVDYPGIISAVWGNLTSNRRARGASTITQQVAKNLLIGNERSYSRKIKEAILAYRIEDALTKQQILELYLNQIALGRNAFGVEAASYAYFDKDLKDLDLAQYAYLAILPKGPSNYDPVRHPDRALGRRAYVLNEMLKDGFIDQAQHDSAMAEPLGTVLRQTPKTELENTGYFIEEVRRELIGKFGESEMDGPYSVYSGGLWVRTSYDPQLQDYAKQALRDGLLRYDGARGWAGPLTHVEIADGDWRQALLNTNMAIDFKDWRVAIAIGPESGGMGIGFANGETGVMSRGDASMPVRGVGGNAYDAIKPGDVIVVAPAGAGEFALRSIPKISGGMVVEQPQTGRVMAMQGGFDSSVQAFNRATQALRQPGSTIKPIVYTAALENGMTPASIVVDGPFCVYQGAHLGNKCFRNFGGENGAGPHTMRWGLEQSRNLMTVRIAAQIGMPKVVALMKALQIGDYQPYLAYSLGAGETTVSRMVNAYTVLANQGRWHAPTLIDYVQDRHGQVVWPDNWQPCDGCNAPDWNGKAMPRPPIPGKQVIDAQSAFQMVHIAEGVIQRGTATVLRDLDRPMFGKTGTNSGPTDVWFIGGTPQMIAGLYMGYDTPHNLGGYAQGGTLAAPIFKEFALKAYDGMDKIPFRAAPGIRMVRIDRASGKPVYGTWPAGDDPKPAVIWEAFKPESEPRRAAHAIEQSGDDGGDSDKPKAARSATPVETPRDSDFLQRQGGIY